jgi:predicted ATPase/DNA-binding SARP family transcriptional activator
MAPTAELRFRDLGPLAVELAGAPVALGGARLTSALSLLLIHAGQHVDADAVTVAMWGADGRPRTSSTLDSHIWRLRKALEPGRGRGEPPRVLLHEPGGGFRLAVAPAAVDSARFEQLAARAREQLDAGQPVDALGSAEGALALWRGCPYDGVAEEPWAAPAVARLIELRSQLREWLVEALLATGDPRRALAELDTSVAETPLRERIWTLRMLAQHRLGRTGDALATYQQAHELLLDELGLEPGPELRELRAGIADGTADPAPAPESSTAEVHLPQRLSPLVGRPGELAATVGLVREASLVTLVGAAGCGKTRLAVEVARTVAGDFPDGVWFVDLTAATGAEQVVAAVASTIGFGADTGEPPAALAAFLAGRRVLLVLDNCEPVLDAVADVVDGWEGRVAVLATSREPLGLDGERVCPLDPLRLPAPDEPDAGTAPAVALLLDRLAAAGVDPADPGVLELAVRIADAVDGVPLALELAAARARAFSLAEIAHQVSADPSALSRVGRGPDHRRTVRAAIEQSYAVLPPAEAALHRRVCVLPGPFTVSAARGVSGTDPDVGDLLPWLVHRSLLVPLGAARPAGPSRFAQLATVRGHAAHAAGADVERLRAHRDDWVCDLVAARPRLGRPEEATWFDALDDDLAALRATLQHTLVDEPSSRGVALAGRLGTYWYFRSKVVEGRAWTERALAVDGADPLVRLTLAHYLASGGRPEQAGPHLDAAFAAVDASGTAGSPVVVEALALIAHALWLASDLDPARAINARIAAAAGADPQLELLAEMCAVMERGALEELAADRVEPVHERAMALENRHVALVVSGSAALAAIRAGDLAAGLRWSDRMIAHRLTLGTTDGPIALELRAMLAAMAGDAREAVRLYAGARAHALRNGLRWPAVPATTAVVERMTAALPAADAERAQAEGARMTLADVQLGANVSGRGGGGGGGGGGCLG